MKNRLKKKDIVLMFLTNLKDENKYLPELSKKILCVVNFVVICNKQCIYIF